MKSESTKAAWLAKHAPHLREEDLKRINEIYPAYLFRCRKTGEIWTTCCGQHIHISDTDDAWKEVMEAPHHREPEAWEGYACHIGAMSGQLTSKPKLVACPICGKKAKVKELGRTGKRDNLNAYYRVVVLRAKEGALWAMAYESRKSYKDVAALTARPQVGLLRVYRFLPGLAEKASRMFDGYPWTGYVSLDTPPSAISTEVTPESIKAELVSRLTAAGLDIDTREGSYTDLIYSEAAYQIYKAWQQFRVLLAAAVPGPDSGPYLDLFAGQYGMARTPASTAHVPLTFTGQDGAVIPAGTVCLTPSGLRFATDLGAAIADGTATAPATAEAAGEGYNVDAGSVTRFLVTIPGVESVTNASPGEGGADGESDASFYERLFTRLSKPVASGNVYYYEQLARQTPGVGQAKTIPLWDGPGTVKVVLASPDKQPVDELIVTQAQQILDEGRVIGADVTAVSAQALEITVTATCTLDGGVQADAVEKQLSGLLQSMFEAMDFGTDDPVRLNQVALRLLSCDGVVDYADLRLNGQSANLSKTVEQVPVLAGVSITPGGA